MKKSEKTLRTLSTSFLTLTLTALLAVSCGQKEETALSRFAYFARVLPACTEQQTYDDFRQWLSTDPASMGYLDKLNSLNIFTSLCWSEDDRLAEVQWMDLEGVQHSLVVVQTGIGYRAYPGTMLDYDSPEPRPGKIETNIIRPFMNGTDTIYVSVSFDKGCPELLENPTFEISTYRLYTDSLCRQDGFFYGEHADSTGSFLRFSYNAEDWKIRNYTQQIFAYSLDNDHNMIYLPVTDNKGRTSDYYHLYLFNDIFTECYQNTVVPSQETGPSLAGYKRLVQHYFADGYYIRIDEMPDGTYRYASWKSKVHPIDMIPQYQQPDIIITGGTFHAPTQTYRFRNGKYNYQVPAFHDMYSEQAGVPVSPYITVTMDGKVIQSLYIEPATL